MEQLQAFATRCGVNVALRAVPGTFVAPGYPLAFLHEQTPSRREGPAGDALADADVAALAQSFEVGRDRTYDEDPRFAFIALSEIASRALSPAVNDPGTAIAIFGSFLRLFSVFAQPLDGEDPQRVRYDRVYVNELSPHDMLEDAFRAAARDGGALVEVQIRLQKTLRAIAELPNAPLADAARAHARAALERAVQTLDFEEDRASVAAAAAWSR